MNTIRMDEMTWVDIKKAISDGFTKVVVGVGSTEQHGPHLPTKTDALIGDVLAEKVARQLGGTLVAQTIRVGCSEHHMKFPGTITLKETTLKAILYDYIESFAQHGFETIILIPSHGGNFHPLKELVEETKKKSMGIKVVGYTDLMGFINFLTPLSDKFGITREESGVHAGENETALVMALEGHLVHKDRLQVGYVGSFGKREADQVLGHGIGALSKIGVLGDPTKATTEHGESYLTDTVHYISSEIKKQL